MEVVLVSIFAMQGPPSGADTWMEVNSQATEDRHLSDRPVRPLYVDLRFLPLLFVDLPLMGLSSRKLRRS